MAGKWDELEQTLKTHAAELDALTGQQKTDLVYIRQSLAETRPPWWKTVKAGLKTAFRATVWGRPLQLTYDPAVKGGLQMDYLNGKLAITVSWPSGDMDSAVQAEHGFSKGELNNLHVFAVLGQAATWSTLPSQSLVNLSEERKVLLGRVLDLQGNLAGVYHATPRARQCPLASGARPSHATCPAAVAVCESARGLLEMKSASKCAGSMAPFRTHGPTWSPSSVADA
jgi:hypothetical protein